MSFESEQVPEEPRDRTRWIWAGVIAAAVVMVLVLWMASGRKGDISQVRAKHILISFDKADPVDRARALDLAASLRERILKGESFAKLAKEFSNDEYSSQRGGDLNWQRKGSFEPAFEDYVWSAPIGEVSDIIQTNYGFHLIFVSARHVSSGDKYDMELDKKAREAGGASSPAGPPQESETPVQ